jgi:RimJ/RimL family protein N-acetyltransferase
MVRESELTNEGDCLSLAVVWPEVGRVVGQVELVWLSKQHRQGEVGFIFNPQYQGKGLATEAATEVLRLGFDQLDLHRIIGRCAAQNDNSARLLKRLGMRQEAHFVHNAVFKGGWREELVYAMLQHEWRARL